MEAAAGAVDRGGAIVEDARLVLSVDGFEGELPFGLSTRRDAYLPALLLLGAVAGAPLGARRKLVCVGAGIATVWVLSLVCVHLTAVWIFATRLEGVYAADSAWRGVLDVVAGALLLPPSNRFALPLVLALGLVIWFGRPQPSAGAA
jgi:hypothetical protein